MLIRWLIFIHILSAITFFLAHGASAAMAFRLRRESNLDRIRAMLDLSGSTMGIYMGSFILMGITGLWMPFILDIWNQVWIWLSIVLILLVVMWMGYFTGRSFRPLRTLVGLPPLAGGKPSEAQPPADLQTIRKHIRSIDLRMMVLIGYGIPMFVLWLMVFKPF